MCKGISALVMITREIIPPDSSLSHPECLFLNTWKMAKIPQGTGVSGSGARIRTAPPLWITERLSSLTSSHCNESQDAQCGGPNFWMTFTRKWAEPHTQRTTRAWSWTKSPHNLSHKHVTFYSHYSLQSMSPLSMFFPLNYLPVCLWWVLTFIIITNNIK